MTTTAKGIPELSTSAFIKDGPTDINTALAAIDALFDVFVPAGTLFATARSSAPTGFLLCDGSAISRTTYAGLFTAISTNYGAGDGSTTFNVPDLRGRVPVGVDGSAGRLATNDALGNSGGEELHTLTTSEMASHDHDSVVGGSKVVAASSPAASWFSNPNVTLSGGGGSIVPSNNGPVTNFTKTGTNGSGTAHNNMQPNLIVNWMIKT